MTRKNRTRLASVVRFAVRVNDLRTNGRMNSRAIANDVL